MRRIFRRHPAAQQQPCSEHDKSRNGCHLDHGEPVFKARIVAHAAKIDQQQQGGEKQHPGHRRDGREPISQVRRGGNQLRADGDRDCRPVPRSSNKSCPWVQVKIAIDTERTGGGMHAGEFAQSQGHGQSDKCGQGKTEDDPRAGDFESGGRSQ